MADNDELGLDDGGASSSPAKKGKMGGLLPGLLKWIIIAVAAIILIVVVVFVTVKIATKGSSGPAGGQPASVSYTAQREILDWYTSLGVIQTTTSDDIPATVRVDVVLGYKKDDKATSTEITQRTVELKDFLRRYFNGKTAAELKNTANEERLKTELRNAINDKYLTSSKIRDVVFLQKDVIEQ